MLIASAKEFGPFRRIPLDVEYEFTKSDLAGFYCATDKTLFFGGVEQILKVKSDGQL